MDDRFRKKHGDSVVQSMLTEDSKYSQSKAFSTKRKGTAKPTWLKPSESMTTEEQVIRVENKMTLAWYSLLKLL